MPNRVLIIDDEWMIVRALRARLGAAGFELHSAPDGASGIQAVRDFRPNAILLDLRLPDMDGFEVFRRLRADPESARVPVVFLTANVQDTARQKARAAGAEGFFSKPYDAKQVVAALRNVCQKKTPRLDPSPI